MLISVSRDDLNRLVLRQLSSLLMFEPKGDDNLHLTRSIDESLERVEYCFSHSRDKYFRRNDDVYFDVCHTDQYAMFLYFLSNTLYRTFDSTLLATKIYYLNKILHSIDVYFEVELPSIFMFVHPLGTVLGRAKYGNYLVVLQHCTVGGNREIYPELGEGIVLYAGASILGQCSIGDNSCIAANVLVKDQDIPPNSVVFGTSPYLAIKECKSPVIETFFTKDTDA